MFNMLSEHLFVRHSLLKEWRRPPTGRLGGGGGGGACKESLAGGFLHPHPFEWGQKRPLKPLLFDFP